MTHPQDVIRINNLRVMGVVGLRHPERDAAQEMIVNIELYLDLSGVASSDSVEGRLNYSHVAQRVIAHVESAQRYTLETLATDIAGICVGFVDVRRARVRVSKPAADRAAESISVEIERTLTDLLTPALIGLGSNVDAAKNLRDSVTRLGAIGEIVAASTVYETSDSGAASNHYLNAVVRVSTSLPAAEIRRVLKRIETEMGRTDGSKPSGRIPIDLDLCLLGGQVIRANDVSIPDEDVPLREYLARGCAELMPDLLYPPTQSSLKDLADQLTGTTNLVARPDVVLIAQAKR